MSRLELSNVIKKGISFLSEQFVMATKRAIPPIVRNFFQLSDLWSARIEIRTYNINGKLIKRRMLK